MKHSRPLLRRLLATLGCAAAAILISTGVFAYLSHEQPLSAAQALETFELELEERLGTTPFAAFGMVRDSVADGTFEISIELDDLGIAALINSERVAVSIPPLGEIAITFAEFRQSLVPMARMFGLDNEIVDMIADGIEELGQFFQIIADIPEQQSEQDYYARALLDFIRAARQDAQMVDLYTGGRTVSAQRTEYIFSNAEFMSLFQDWIDLLADDPVASLFLDETAIAFLRDALEDIDRDFEAFATMAIYAGIQGRLLRLEISGGLSFEGQGAYLDAAFDFGSHAMDTWRMDLKTHNDLGDEAEVTITWDISKEGGLYINTFEITLHDESDESTVLEVFWIPIGGEIDMFGLRGHFVTYDETFNLRFEITDGVIIQISNYCEPH